LLQHHPDPPEVKNLLSSSTEPRRGSPDPTLQESEFKRRFLLPYRDPAFDSLSAELDRIAQAAWDGYSHGRKSPRTREAGSEFADPSYELAVEWLAAREAILRAQLEHRERDRPARLLLVNGAARSEHTCPGEMSKSYRLMTLARNALEAQAACEIEILDLSRLASEYGRKIHPCKTCFSTAAPLCHWPCSCYPNYSLGQTQDWMNEIYPMWVAADGILLITPVNWYHTSSPLKLMMDRLVCADGGSPDPTRTHGKDAGRAKEIELAGWDYPQHLKGRVFSCVVHGDTEGAENVRRSVADWLTSMGLIAASALDRYIGYWGPYATSHEALDADEALQQEVREAALTLLEAVRAIRSGRQLVPESSTQPARQK
jgi:multimeric flavodoxin WrbA